jgi:hypothetical protein
MKMRVPKPGSQGQTIIAVMEGAPDSKSEAWETISAGGAPYGASQAWNFRPQAPGMVFWTPRYST